MGRKEETTAGGEEGERTGEEEEVEVRGERVNDEDSDFATDTVAVEGTCC